MRMKTAEGNKMHYDRSICFPQGFAASAVSAGIKSNGLNDLGLVYAENGAVVASVFTLNRFQAAPVLVSRKNISSSHGKVSAILVNSGCANSLTGKSGIRSAERMLSEIARQLHVGKNTVLAASTGVIGKHLPEKSISESIPSLVAGLSVDGDTRFAQSIMTTDKFPKQVATEIRIGKETFRIGGTAKGAGMIHPNMATMLCFITTDAAVDRRVLQNALTRATDRSFNTITVDGDTSTNDTVFLLANGASGVKIKTTSEINLFTDALTVIMRELATMIVRDGEGATRFVRLKIESAANYHDAVRVGRAVGTSPLVKTAIFGGDPNWGRVLSAVGNSTANYDPSRVELNIGEVCVFKKNEPQRVDQVKLKELFSTKEIEMTVKLNAGRESAQVFTCDLSYDYVKINGEYTT